MSFFNIDEVLDSSQGSSSSRPTLEVSSFLTISPATASSVFMGGVSNAFNRFTNNNNNYNNNNFDSSNNNNQFNGIASTTNNPNTSSSSSSTSFAGSLNQRIQNVINSGKKRTEEWQRKNKKSNNNLNNNHSDNNLNSTSSINNKTTTTTSTNSSLSSGYFHRMWNFVKRHKKKFIGTGVVLGGIGIGFLYLYYRYQQIVQEMKREELNAARMRIHFDNNRRTALSAVRSQLSSVNRFLQDSLQLQTITPQLKNKNLNSDEKLKLWNQYKNQSFIKTVTSIYSITFMYVLLSVQLHIIGRYLFLKYISEEENRRPVGSTSEAISLSSDVQQQFLSYIAHFQSSGINLVFQRVSSAVEDVISQYDLKSKISADTARNIIDSIRDSVEGLVLDDNTDAENIPRWNLTTMLLPPFTDQPSSASLSSSVSSKQNHKTLNIIDTENNNDNNDNNNNNENNENNDEVDPDTNDGDDDDEDEDDGDDDNALPPPPVSYAEMHPDLKLLVDELISILQTDEFSSIIDAALSSAFSLFTDRLESAIARKSQASASASSSASASVEHEDPAVFLAIILPFITKESDHVISSSQDNEYLACLYQVESLNMFCAKVYSGESS